LSEPEQGKHVWISSVGLGEASDRCWKPFNHTQS
jgi:hypothetical protein